MYTHFAVTILAAVGLMSISCARIQRAAPIFLSDADIMWIMNTADTSDIERGRLAETQGTHPKVQAFGRRMVADHQTLLKYSTMISRRFSIKPVAPALGVEITERHEETMRNLDGKSGMSFDRAYIDSEIAIHRRLVDLVGNAARTVNHVALKEHLRLAKPLLQSHLEEARSIKRDLVAQAD